MPSPTRAILATLALLPLAQLPLVQPALARQAEKPITAKDPSALDIAKTPVTDLNLDSKDIPPILIKASDKPYDLTGIDTCEQLAGAVHELFQALGPDIDIPQEERDRISAGRVAKWVVSSFIPFRGLIREISGANEHERKVRLAIQAGMTRRGFLKGVGAMRGCPYPASPATPADIARIHAELDRREKEAGAMERGDTEAGSQPQDRTSKGLPIVNQPVVQKIP